MKHQNGSESILSTGPWMQLLRVRSCPVFRRDESACSAEFHPTGAVRSVEVTGEPDTFFSIPGRASFAGVKVPGFLTVRPAEDYTGRPEGYEFVPTPRTDRQREAVASL